MLNYIEKITNEKNELDEKIAKLSLFLSLPIDTKLSVEHRSLLMSQEVCMKHYSNILSQRLKLMTNDHN